MPTFSTGGILGGGGGGIGGGGDEDDESVAWWRAIGSIAKTRQAWLVAGGVLLAIYLAVLLGGRGAKQEGELCARRASYGSILFFLVLVALHDLQDS